MDKTETNMNLFELTKKLMSVPSTSGEVEAFGFYLRDHLRSSLKVLNYS